MKLNKRIIALALAALLLGMSALAEATVTVRGMGVVNVDADRAGVSLGVREVAPDVMAAQARVNEKISAIIGALKEKGVPGDAISTNGIGIYPNYNYDEDDTISGYTAYNNIYFTLEDVNGTGAMIDAAFAAGANSLDYVEFSAAETDEAASQALVLAVDSAREKAQALADAAGLKLGGILEIREGEDIGYDANALYARSEEADAGSGTEVLASRQKVAANVVITWALEE